MPAKHLPATRPDREGRLVAGCSSEFEILPDPWPRRYLSARRQECLPRPRPQAQVQRGTEAHPGDGPLEPPRLGARRRGNASAGPPQPRAGGSARLSRRGGGHRPSDSPLQGGLPLGAAPAVHGPAHRGRPRGAGVAGPPGGLGSRPRSSWCRAVSWSTCCSPAAACSCGQRPRCGISRTRDGRSASRATHGVSDPVPRGWWTLGPRSLARPPLAIAVTLVVVWGSAGYARCSVAARSRRPRGVLVSLLRGFGCAPPVVGCCGHRAHGVRPTPDARPAAQEHQDRRHRWSTLSHQNFFLVTQLLGSLSRDWEPGDEFCRARMAAWQASRAQVAWAAPLASRLQPDAKGVSDECVTLRGLRPPCWPPGAFF